MGCGSSKDSTPVAEKSNGARNDNPPIEPINVPDIDPRYPPPEPPPNTKDDIYRHSDYTAIDTRVKQQSRTYRTNTYDILIKSICANCTTELQKLRAIMVWLFLQDIHGSFYSGVTDPYTPRGYMKLIKARGGSYAAFLAQLCRAAGIPCNVIRGLGKGDKYEVGQQDLSHLESSWNAVYVADGWRLIHPLWAIYKEKQVDENKQSPPAGTKRSDIDEFFYLIDPNRLICFCKPHLDPWQLLKVKWEHRKFVKSPKFTQHYFTSGLMLPKKYNAIIYSDNGICVIDFDHQEYADPSLDATLTFNKDMSSDVMPQGTDLKDFIARVNTNSRKSVIFRFPVRGRYEADLFGGVSSGDPKIVEFRIECDDVGRDPQPFPMHPPGGFGLQPVASQFGISDPVPDSGIILVKPAQVKHFSFTCTQRLEAQATLFHNRVSSESFEDFLSTKCTADEVHVTVAIPDEELLEFALQIAVRPDGATRDFTVVANYLLVDENWKKKTAVVTPRPRISKNDEERLRKTLIAATQKNDIERLESAMLDFERNGLPDNGDLTRARHKLYQLHLQRLRKATLERKLEELDYAIESAKKSPVALDLIDTKEMNEAIMTRQQLRRLRLYMHKVLALNKATISEIHSYQRPRPLVHTVMKATFRILGEPRSKLQDWSYIQSSMRTLGRNSMISRMRRTDIVHLKKGQMKDAENYLSQTNKHLVRMCSAGAGTFYVWSNNMVSEFYGDKNLDPLDVWNSNNKWAKTKPSPRRQRIESRASEQLQDDPALRETDEFSGESAAEDDWNPNRTPTSKHGNPREEEDEDRPRKKLETIEEAKPLKTKKNGKPKNQDYNYEYDQEGAKQNKKKKTESTDELGQKSKQKDLFETTRNRRPSDDWDPRNKRTPQREYSQDKKPRREQFENKENQGLARNNSKNSAGKESLKTNKENSPARKVKKYESLLENDDRRYSEQIDNKPKPGRR
ncbi:hillarin [Biomphalaria glabrata]|nr:hillarin [Biomphalaria glabrata]